jgi:hypothetical protein
MRVVLLLAVGLVAGCASGQKTIEGAVVTPLNDLNLMNSNIPEVLKEARKAPYALPESSTCDDIRIAVLALDDALGPDLDTPETKENRSLIERGGTAMSGAVQNAAEGVIPFRSWVRKLSGAERKSRQVKAAITAGTVRRGFLKGVAKAKACDLAAPAVAQGAIG